MNAPHVEADDGPPGKRRVVLLAPLVPLIFVVVAWYAADLSALRSPERIADMAQQLRDSPLGIAYVALAFALGTMLFFPVTALIAGTALAFDPLRGFCYALVGALIGASITYWAGRASGSAALDYASGPRLSRIRHELCTRAFRASVIARVLPVGNFTVINLIAGSLRIPFRAFFFGNLVGLAPGVLCLTLFADRLAEVVQHPSKQNIAIIAVVALALAVLFLLLRYLGKRGARNLEEPGTS